MDFYIGNSYGSSIQLYGIPETSKNIIIEEEAPVAKKQKFEGKTTIKTINVYIFFKNLKWKQNI